MISAKVKNYVEIRMLDDCIPTANKAREIEIENCTLLTFLCLNVKF